MIFQKLLKPEIEMENEREGIFYDVEKNAITMCLVYRITRCDIDKNLSYADVREEEAFS